MKPVISCFTKSYIDCLGDKMFKEGEFIKINWTDGTCTITTVWYDTSTDDCGVLYKRAFINHKFHNDVSARIYLADNPQLLCERV